MKWYWIAVVFLLATFINVHQYWLPELDHKSSEQARYEYSTGLIAAGDIEERTRILTKAYKDDFRDEDGTTYLLGGDSWYFYRLMRDAAEDGEIGEVIEKSRYDQQRINTAIPSFMLFPSVAGYLSSALRFNSPMFFAYFFPTALLLLSLMFVYLLAERWFGECPALFAVLALSLHQRFWYATQAGNFDTSSLVILFTVMIVYFFVRVEDGWWWNIPLLISLTGFYLVWMGWVYIIPVLMVMFFGGLWRTKFNTEYWKKYIPLSLVMTAAFASKPVFFISFVQRVVSYLDTTSNPLFATVSELYPLGFGGLLDAYTLLFVMLYVSGVVMVILKKHIQGIVVFIWSLPLLILSTYSLRSSHYAIIPMAMIVGLSISWLVDNFEKLISVKNSGVVMGLLVFGFLMVYPYFQYNSDCRTCPLMNDALWSVGEYLKETSQDSYIITWWDYGYLLQATSGRKTNTDGGAFDLQREQKFASMLLGNQFDKKQLNEIFSTNPPNGTVIYIVLPEELVRKSSSMIYLLEPEQFMSIRSIPPIALKSSVCIQCNRTGEVSFETDKILLSASVNPKFSKSLLVTLLFKQREVDGLKLEFDSGPRTPYGDRVVVYRVV